jgi:hypothetical protein
MPYNLACSGGVPPKAGPVPAFHRHRQLRDAAIMRTQLNTHSVLHSLFRSGLPWLLVAVLLLGNLILSQTSAVLN